MIPWSGSSSLLTAGLDKGGGPALPFGCAHCARLRALVVARSQPGLRLPSCAPELSVQKGCLLKTHSKAAVGVGMGGGMGGSGGGVRGGVAISAKSYCHSFNLCWFLT